MQAFPESPSFSIISRIRLLAEFFGGVDVSHPSGLIAAECVFLLKEGRSLSEEVEHLWKPKSC